MVLSFFIFIRKLTILWFGFLITFYFVCPGYKTREKKPRESILRAEFGNAIALINKDLTGESRLKFLHWDLNKYSKKYVGYSLLKFHFLKS